MEKKTGSYVYVQRYRKEWEKDSKYEKWLRPVQGNGSKVMCIWCNIEFNARIFEIKRHLESKKHTEKSRPFASNQTTLSIEKVDTCGKPEVHRAEALLSMFVAEHTAILPIDHLGLLCAKAFTDSKAVRDMKLHRTKCSEILKNVLGPHFKSNLRKDVGDSKYSLIIDESTDITVHKYLGLVIRYSSSSMKKVTSTFFALIQLETCNARGIVDAIVKAIQEMDLNIQNMVGLGTDNASVMIGINNGVYKILKEEYDLPHLILVKCVCHSLQLSVSHASEETIPRNIEFLLRETYNWFSVSAIRRQEYTTIFASINCGKQPLKILQKCATRWLSIEPAVQRILEQWSELKEFFAMAKTKNNCYMADCLHNIYSNPQYKAYLVYIKSILAQVQLALKAFEGKNSDPTKLLDSLITLLESLCDIVITPGRRHSFDIFEGNVQMYLDPSPYLGYAFNTSVQSYSDTDKNVLRQRCIDFTVKLIKELQQRLPENVKILKNMSIMSVTEALKPIKNLDEIIKLAEHFEKNPEVIDKIVSQWRNIINNKWSNKTDTVKFWFEVAQYKNASHENPYKELVELAFTILTLPHSNADVERVFSLMNIVKNKLRNKMSLETLNSILYIRTGLKNLDKTCHNYEIPEEVLKKIGKKDMYTFKLKKSAESTREPQPSTSTSSAIQEEEENLEETDDEYDNWI